MNIKTWPRHTDKRGGFLLPCEFSEVPFVPLRIFSVTDVPAGSIRGEHAHYETSQLLICLEGQIELTISTALDHETRVLSPGDSALIAPLEWGRQKFLTGRDSLLVLCSTPYSQSDYITDWEDFQKKSLDSLKSSATVTP